MTVPEKKKFRKLIRMVDSEYRARAFVRMCEWISTGHSIRSFTFDEDGVEITGDMLHRHMKEHPEEYSETKFEMAMARCLALMEKILLESMQGINTKSNCASIQMYMRNRFGWDKRVDHDKEYDMSKWKEFKDFMKDCLKDARTSPEKAAEAVLGASVEMMNVAPKVPPPAVAVGKGSTVDPTLCRRQIGIGG